MKQDVVLFCVFLLSYCLAGNITQTVEFADRNWNCANAACTRRVQSDQYQPNYQCAEFCSRSLVAGNFIAGLGTHSSQNAYEYYNYDGTVYNLLWVSSGQGSYLGLEDLLQVLNWRNVGTDSSLIEKGSILICDGADGPRSHSAIGVSYDLTDAHNMAHYHRSASVYIGINAIYHPPL